MTTEIISSSWTTRFQEAMRLAKEEILLMAPFIHPEPLRLLPERTAARIRVLTRFDTRAFYEKVSSLDALGLLLERGAEIKGIQHLHTKLYVFDHRLAIITSANLTGAAFQRNHELGIVTRDPQLVADARKYFEDLWERTDAALSSSQLDVWRDDIAQVAAEAAFPQPAVLALADHGADLGTDLGRTPVLLPDVIEEPDGFASPPQWFIKFSAKADDRAPRSMSVRDAVQRSGFQSAGFYSKRPKRVQDGAVIFTARLVKKPDDIMIFGRALAQAHVRGRDETSEADIRARPWKAHWRFLVRIHDVEFMNGSLEQGVSLNELMDELGAESFRSTSENAARGDGKNTNPRRAYQRKDHVQLTPTAAAWLTERLIERMRTYGRLTETAFAWPQ